MEKLEQPIVSEVFTSTSSTPDIVPLPGNNIQIKKRIIGFGLALGVFMMLLLTFLYFKGNDDKKSPSSDTVSTQDPNTFQGRVLARSSLLIKQNARYYWVNPDGSIIASLDFKIPFDEEQQLVQSASLSPDHSKILVTVGDKREGDEYLRLMEQSLTGTPDPQPEWNFQYDYYVTSLQGEVVSTLDTETVKSRIGSFKNVDFLNWATNDSLYFEAKDARALFSEAPEIRVILGKYNVNTQEVKVLVDRQARGIGTPYLSKDGQWLKYTKDYGLYPSQLVLKNLGTQEERVITNNGYLFTDGEYWVAFPGAGGSFKSNLNEQIGLVISSITDPQTPIGTVNLAEPGRYFVGGYQSLSWSNDSSLFAVIAEYDRSGYAIPYQEPQLFVYDRQGNQQCMWELADSDLSNNSIHPEFYSEKVFSPDNRYLLLVSKPNADFFGTSYWRSFDLSNCSVHKSKTKIEEGLIPLAWL